jgi:ATP-dependent protease ClpP protease subunit
MSGSVDFTSGTEDLRDVCLIEPGALGSVGSPSGTESVLAQFFPGGELPSMENLEDLIKNSKVKDGDCSCDNGNAKPLVSKVIDAEGNAKIVIIYDGCPFTGGGDTATIVALLDSTTANDVVDITIAMSVADFINGGGTSIWTSLSLLSALKRCKAKVITRAGALTSLIDCALWLSGRERVIGPAGLIMVRQPRDGFYGSTEDAKTHVAATKQVLKDLISFIVSKGLFTQEEIDAMFENNSQIFLAGDALDARISSIKD